jgi:hypothetical protein
MAEWTLLLDQKRAPLWILFQTAHDVAAECEKKATEATDVEAKRLLQEAAIE